MGSVSSIAHATVSVPRHARTTRAAAVRRSSGSRPSVATRAIRRARSSRPTCTMATGSASAAERRRRPSKSPSSRRTKRLPATSARTSASTSVGSTAVSSTFIPCFYHRRVRARILGSAAGGGFPQWNCRCPTCEAARTGAARPRTQSSLAIRGGDGPWFLANASPDLRQQLEGLATEPATAVRRAPVAGVLLTDAEIDHTAGLLLLRESSTAMRVYGSEQVRRALTDGDPVLPILSSYSGVDWRTLEPGGPISLDGSSLEVESFAAGGDAPRYLAGTGADVEATGLVFRDRSTGGVLTYVPGLARLDDDVLGRLAASDVVLVDGTFWRDDELARLGIAERTARQMGHVPLSGDDGSLATLAGLERPRVILVHINNTNPVLLESSPERDAVLRAGVEVADDGLEVQL